MATATVTATTTSSSSRRQVGPGTNFQATGTSAIRAPKAAAASVSRVARSSLDREQETFWCGQGRYSRSRDGPSATRRDFPFQSRSCSPDPSTNINITFPNNNNNNNNNNNDAAAPASPVSPLYSFRRSFALRSALSASAIRPGSAQTPQQPPQTRSPNSRSSLSPEPSSSPPPLSRLPRSSHHAARRPSTAPGPAALKQPLSSPVSASARAAARTAVSCTSPTAPSASSPCLSRLDRRSSSRRPPASFSANGIETAFGPPSALVTRTASYGSDFAWRTQSPPAAPQSPTYHPEGPPPGRQTALERGSQQPERPPSGIITSLGDRPAMESLDAVVRGNRTSWSRGASEIPSPKSEFMRNHNRPRTLRQLTDEAMESSQSSEDLFLKLADDADERTRNAYPASPTSQLPPRGRPSAHQFPSQTASQPGRRNSSPPEPSFSSDRPSIPYDLANARRRTGAASVVGVTGRRPPSMNAEQKLSAYRTRYMASAAPSVISRVSDSASATYAQRRASATDFAANRHSQRLSRLGQPQSREADYSNHRRTSFQQDPRADGDSVVSTVQSAVWDEMPDAKSHLHRLDQSRTFQSSGGTGSNGSGERPRTATTTVTTVSSSPKVALGSKLGIADPKLGGPEASNIHPLLHQSLDRCKPILNPTLYRALSNAASDALEMAASSRGGGNGSVYANSSATGGIASDRQLRRRADNLCRNLTDLCIALIESSPESANRASALANRRQSRELSAPPQIPEARSVYSRQASVEPGERERRPTPSRALERVEARRASLMSTSTPGGSPRETSFPAQRKTQHLEAPQSSPLAPSAALPPSTPSSLLAPSSMLRSGTSMLRSHRMAAAEEDDDSSLRPPSRATTEIGTLRKRSGRLSVGLSRADYAYTSQHPLPQSSALRRVTGGTMSSPLAPLSAASSVVSRGVSRQYYGDRLQPPLDTTEEDEKKTKRRSFGLYAGSGSAVGRPLGRVGSLTKKRASLTAGQ